MSFITVSDFPMRQWRRVISEELRGLSLRRALFSVADRLLPVGVGGRLRACLYRGLGCSVGHGTILVGPMGFGVGSRLQNLEIGTHCFVNAGVFIDAAAPVILGDHVSVGHHVVIITTNHAIGPSEFRAGAVQLAPVTIGAGAWIAAGVTLLPGVTIGSGAVVAAGAVVTKDVAPNMLVGGVPAQVIRALE